MQKLVFSDNFIVIMILWSCVKHGRNIEWRTWIRCSVKAGDKNFGWHMDCVQNYVYIWLNRNRVNIESIKVEDQTCRHFTIKILWWIRGSKDNLEYVASNIKEKRNIRYWDIMVLKKIKLFKKERVWEKQCLLSLDVGPDAVLNTLLSSSCLVVTGRKVIITVPTLEIRGV